MPFKYSIKCFYLVWFIVLTGCTHSNNNVTAPMSDGMALIINTNSTIAYQRAGVDYSVYDKVKILPSEIAFKKNWQKNYNRKQSSLTTQVKDDDVLLIKNNLAKLFNKVFIKTFSQEADFSIVSDVSSNTLVIRPAIIELDLHAPNVKTSSHVRIYTQEKGEATLYLELYDGVTGQLLARLMDASVIGDDTHFAWSNRVNNQTDAIKMIKRWAHALRAKFDQARDNT